MNAASVRKVEQIPMRLKGWWYVERPERSRCEIPDVRQLGSSVVVLVTVLVDFCALVQCRVPGIRVSRVGLAAENWS